MQENKQEKSPIKQNILRYLAQKGVSAYEFYKESGVTRGILQQNNGISEDNIARFLAYAPDVNIEWLLTGEGPMLSHPTTPTPPTQPTTPTKPTSHPSTSGIPLIPLDAVAGFPAESGGGVRLEDCERYVIPEFENKGANFLIRVSGDSMVPLYYSGDLLACRKITDIRFFQWGTVYVLETSQGGTRQTRAGKRRSCRQHSMRVGKQQCSSPFPPPTRRHT